MNGKIKEDRSAGPGGRKERSKKETPTAKVGEEGQHQGAIHYASDDGLRKIEGGRRIKSRSESKKM
jgi:hypothetical protein